MLFTTPAPDGRWDENEQEDIPDTRTIRNPHLSKLEADSGQRALWYNNPAFGRSFIDQHINQGLRLSPQVTEPYLRRYYEYRRYGHYYEDICEATSWTDPIRAYDKSVVQCLLIAQEPLEESAQMVGYDLEALKAYDQLYFNVRDRRNDLAYLTQLVYPAGRKPEYMQDYLESVLLEKWAMRAAYNNGIDDALHLLGFRSRLPEGGDLSQAFHQLVMANALVSGRNGGINQRGQPAIRAGLSIASSELIGGSGGNSSDNALGVDDVFHTMVEEYAAMSKQNRGYDHNIPNTDTHQMSLINPDEQSNRDKIKSNLT